MPLLSALREEISTLEEITKAQERLFLDAELPQVILLHGYSLKKSSLQVLALSLQSSYEVARFQYPSGQELEKTAKELLDEVKAVTDLRGEAISLVGHSMGGLLATRVAQEYPAGVKKVVALGTPFNGTYTAYTYYPLKKASVDHKSVQQMIPNSQFLQELHQNGFPQEVRFASIYSSDDLIVIPQTSSRLPEQENTQNLALSGIGHLGLLGKRVYALVENCLR